MICKCIEMPAFETNNKFLSCPFVSGLVRTHSRKTFIVVGGGFARKALHAYLETL